MYLIQQSPDVDLQENSLSFSAIGNGAHGENKYGFSLKFLRPIDTEVIYISLNCLIDYGFCLMADLI